MNYMPKSGLKRAAGRSPETCRANCLCRTDFFEQWLPKIEFATYFCIWHIHALCTGAFMISFLYIDQMLLLPVVVQFAAEIRQKPFINRISGKFSVHLRHILFKVSRGKYQLKRRSGNPWKARWECAHKSYELRSRMLRESKSETGDDQIKAKSGYVVVYFYSDTVCSFLNYIPTW